MTCQYLALVSTIFRVQDVNRLTLVNSKAGQLDRALEGKDAVQQAYREAYV